MSDTNFRQKTLTRLKFAFLRYLGRCASYLTGDPVLRDFIEVIGASVPASSLFVVIAWRLAMGIGTFLSRFESISRWVFKRSQLLHKLNLKFDQTAQAIAATPLASDSIRLQWCRIFGIDPQRDLNAPLSTFKTVNDLFIHLPGPGTRPVASPLDPGIVTAPCDGSYAMLQNTESLRSFVSKQSHFEIRGALGKNAASLAEHFTGGAAAFIWLSAVDNHNWFAPISGRILHAEVVDATTHGRMGLFMEDRYCEANTRGVIVMESEDGFKIAFIPIGLTPINSIFVSVSVGDFVAKGDSLGRFEIGGSAGLIFFDRRLKVDCGADHISVSSAEDLLNLNYVGADNKMRKLIGQPLAQITRPAVN